MLTHTTNKVFGLSCSCCCYCYCLRAAAPAGLAPAGLAAPAAGGGSGMAFFRAMFNTCRTTAQAHEAGKHKKKEQCRCLTAAMSTRECPRGEVPSRTMQHAHGQQAQQHPACSRHSHGLPQLSLLCQRLVLNHSLQHSHRCWQLLCGACYDRQQPSALLQ